MTCSWHNGGHVGGKKNSDKVFDEKEFDYYFANLERYFAIALTTDMGVSSRDNSEDKYSSIKPSDESHRFDSVMSDILRQKFRCAVDCRPSFHEKGSFKKLRRQLQRKRQIKIELYVKLSVL